MRVIFLTFLTVLGIFCSISPCGAYSQPSANSLPFTVEQAQAIAVFKVDSLNLKPKPVPQASGPEEIFSGSDAFIAFSTFEGEGTYDLTLAKTIKGKLNDKLTIEFPTLTGLGYSSTFHLKTGDFLVAFLKKEDDKWVAQDRWRPFVPLFAASDFTTAPDENPLQQVESLILPELKSGATRLMAVDLLSNSANPQVMMALAPYLDDPDLQVRDFVLTMFARQQQLSAIPRIRDLNRATNAAQRGNPRAMFELRNYSGLKEAVPLLNPLLFEDERFIRVNTLGTLSRTKDKSSIPFLLLTLYDPSGQGSNALQAYAVFAQVSHAKLSVGDRDSGLSPAQARKAAWSWWQDELSGKHSADPDEKPAVSLRQGQRFEASDLPQLNLGLFMKSEFTRQEAIRGLGQFADQSSVPYLLIALYDPQPEIAYSAYTLLHRLVPDLGAATPSKWRNEREAQTRLAFDWWQKHLLDAEKK